MVVGIADTSTPDPNSANCPPECFIFHAFRWKKGTLTDLGTIPGGNSNDAIWVNNRGQTVGTSQNGLINPLVGVPENRAVLWQKDGQIIDLGTLGGNDSAAFAINDRGEVVGGALNDILDPFSFPGLATQSRAFLWQDGIMQDLGPLGGPDAFATAINDRSQIAGISMTNSTPNATTSFPTFHPFPWENGKMLDLGSLRGTQAAPSGIGDPLEGQRALNNRGQVFDTRRRFDDSPFSLGWGNTSGLGNARRHFRTCSCAQQRRRGYRRSLWAMTRFTPFCGETA